MVTAATYEVTEVSWVSLSSYSLRPVLLEIQGTVKSTDRHFKQERTEEKGGKKSVGNCIYYHLFLTQNRTGRQNFFFFEWQKRKQENYYSFWEIKVVLCSWQKYKTSRSVLVKYLLEDILLPWHKRALRLRNPLKL